MTATHDKQWIEAPELGTDNKRVYFKFIIKGQEGYYDSCYIPRIIYDQLRRDAVDEYKQGHLAKVVLAVDTGAKLKVLNDLENVKFIGKELTDTYSYEWKEFRAKTLGEQNNERK